MPCLYPTRWSWVQMPVQGTGLGLPWDSCGCLGRAELPACLEEGGKEGGKAGLIAEQSRHGWSETNQELNCCLAGSPGGKDWCRSAWWTPVAAHGEDGWKHTGVCVFILQHESVELAAQRCWQHGLGWVLACNWCAARHRVVSWV